VIFGLDVSKHQGKIDWHAVARAPQIAVPRAPGSEQVIQRPGAGAVTFAIAKLTGEETAGPLPFRDARGRENWIGMREAGLVRGCYHFMDGGKGSGSGKAEAEALLQAVQDYGGFKPGDLVPALDVEWPPQGGSLFDVHQLWDAVQVIWSELGHFPIIYTGRWYWQDIPNPDDLRDLAANGCPLWLAAYTRSRPKAPAPWEGWPDIWQFTDKGRVAGIAGPVDVNEAATLEGMTL
jgi:lysozyme